MPLAKFRCASWSGRDHFGCFEKHSCSVHFCLMNLKMISQTAQCWSSDDVSLSLRSEKEIFGIRKRAFNCLSVIIVQFSMFFFELY